MIQVLQKYPTENIYSIESTKKPFNNTQQKSDEQLLPLRFTFLSFNFTKIFIENSPNSAYDNQWQIRGTNIQRSPQLKLHDIVQKQHISQNYSF